MRKFVYIPTFILILAILQPTLLSSVVGPVLAPDFVAVVVAAQAFARSFQLGMAIAVFAGIVVDLIAPASGVFGISAIAFLVVAILAKRTSPAPHDSALRPLLTAALAPTLALGIRLMLTLVTAGSVPWSEILTLILSQLIWGLVIASLLVPAIDLIDRKMYNANRPIRVNR